MSHALYTALSGAVSQERSLEVISDNMANITTPGFKGSRLSFRELVAAQDEGQKDGSPRRQVEVASLENDMTQGPIRQTGAPLDVALKGLGYFVVQAHDTERLTRQGAFVHHGDGTLRTQSGFVVQGLSGPISAPYNLPMTVDSTGKVYSMGVFVDQIRRVHTDASNLSREGNSTFAVKDGVELQEVLTPLETGALEGSNVNAVTAMTQMINTQRHWEMHHRAIESIRALEQKTSEQLG